MDINLNFEKYGSGEPLILLHGNGEDHSVFSKQRDAFGSHFTVYAVDTRGHGDTPRGSQPFTISQFADDLCGFMDSEGIDRAHILGFSDGANIAMVFAVKYPERVDKLILNSGNFAVSGLKKYFLLPCRLMRFAATKKGDVRKIELLDLMLDDLGIDEKDLAEITAPTLVIAGNRDLIKASHTKAIAKSIPNSELKIIRGNHAALRVNPREFNRAVLDFLTE